MSEKPRIKRMDRAGNTANIPSTRSLTEVKAQRWIANLFYRLLGRGAFFWENPEEFVGQSIARGADYFDLKDAGSRIKSLEEAPKENIRSARQLGDLAAREEAAGHFETACDYYFRSVLFYVAASWTILDSDDPEFIWISDQIRNNFEKVARFSGYPIEMVEIPWEGRSIPGILCLAPGKKKAPTVLVVPGMDQHKENAIHYLKNPFVSRGMNCLVIDGPGQGESLLRKIWVDQENYGRAGKAAIDFLVKCPEVDPHKIGLQGMSMGTYWGPLIALNDSRVKALSAQMSCQYNKDHIFNETGPNFRLRFIWMAGNPSDEEFDRIAAKMTLEGRESQIQCPHIIFHGEFDHLTMTAEVYRYFNRLGSTIKELRIYENQFHGLYRFADETSSMSADWLRDRLTGVSPRQNRRIVLVDWNKKEHPVDEEKLAQGFSCFVAD